MTGLAFLFPGQGSQSVGMLDAYPDEGGVVSRTVDEASEALGYDLAETISAGPETTLNRTEVTQPALLTAGVAVHRLWQARGGASPDAMAGHSLGEYAALVVAGSLAFRDAVRLVAERARLMREAVTEGEGKMAAILGLDDATVTDLCDQALDAGEVTAANFNAPGQVVVAGESAAVDTVVAAAKEAGAKRAMELPVSVPSHSPLMFTAGSRLAEALRRTDVQAPAIPVINNVDVEAPTEPDLIRDALARQVAHPVQWVRTIGAMRERGIDTGVELGPGKVLCGLVKRIDRNLPCTPVVDEASLQQALEQAG